MKSSIGLALVTVVAAIVGTVGAGTGNCVSIQPVGPTGGTYSVAYDDEFGEGSLTNNPNWSAVSPFSPNGNNTWATNRVWIDKYGYLMEENLNGTSGIASTAPGYARSPVTFSRGSVVEARVWLPVDANGKIEDWPAFWGDGQNWPGDGEIDVMEGLGGLAAYHIHDGTYPDGVGNDVNGSYGGKWVTFTADWNVNGGVSFYYDGVKVGSETLDSAANSKSEFLTLELNTGEGGTTVNGSQVSWDYVRVWNGG